VAHFASSGGVDLSFSDEQRLLRDSVRRFLETASPMSEVRRAMGTSEGFDRALWTRLSSDLALQAVAIPEVYGGLGLGPVELAIVLEELGRALVCAPYFASVVLACRAILHQGSAADHEELLPSLASGESIAALVCDEHGGTTTTARVTDGRWALDGTTPLVIDGHIADRLIVAARSGAGVSLFVVDAGANGVTRTALPTLDSTRRLARIELRGAPARLLGDDGTAASAIARTLDEGAILLSCEMVGGAERALQLAVEYAKVRTQFGRAIGSFQAIKHKCADMLLAVESARSAAYWAACVLGQPDTGPEADAELAIAASVAKSYANEAYFQVAAECIQVHGGIGFTWEHDAHLYFKRARASAALLGDASYHRARIASAVGLDAGSSRSTLS
jgi:alkylation response protein AidB-like acyl-CoA dehydrogenase